MRKGDAIKKEENLTPQKGDPLCQIQRLISLQSFFIGRPKQLSKNKRRPKLIFYEKYIYIYFGAETANLVAVV